MFWEANIARIIKEKLKLVQEAYPVQVLQEIVVSLTFNNINAGVAMATDAENR